MANTKILQLPVAVSLDGSEYLELVQGGTSKRATAQKIGKTLLGTIPASIEYVMDGAGGPISPGVKGYLVVPFDGTITEAFLYGDTSGSITVNIWKCSYANFDAGVTHPVAADSITGGNPPVLVGQSKSDNTALTGWNTTLSMSDVLAFQVPTSAVNITRVTVALNITRSLN